MPMRALMSWTGVVAILLGLVATAGAEETMKHSGSVVSIADDGWTFVLAEVGPWQVRDGATVITYRTITLMPQTTYAIVARAQAAPSGFGGDFVETGLGRDRLHPNDYVTVDCRHEGRRLLALKITAIEPRADVEENRRR
jgi:hypothetical protein